MAKSVYSSCRVWVSELAWLLTTTYHSGFRGPGIFFWPPASQRVHALHFWDWEVQPKLFHSSLSLVRNSLILLKTAEVQSLAPLRIHPGCFWFLYRFSIKNIILKMILCLLTLDSLDIIVFYDLQWILMRLCKPKRC